MLCLRCIVSVALNDFNLFWLLCCVSGVLSLSLWTILIYFGCYVVSPLCFLCRFRMHASSFERGAWRSSVEKGIIGRAHTHASTNAKEHLHTNTCVMIIQYKYYGYNYKHKYNNTNTYVMIIQRHEKGRMSLQDAYVIFRI